MVLQKKLKDTTLTAVVPNHRELAAGTLRSILRRIGLSADELTKLLAAVVGILPHL